MKPMLLAPRFKYGLVLTIGNARPLLEKRLSNSSHSESKNDPILIEKMVNSIIIETYRAQMFDRQRSLLMLPIYHHKPEKVSVVVRLRSGRDGGCVLFFAIWILESGEALWFCEILPR